MKQPSNHKGWIFRYQILIYLTVFTCCSIFAQSPASLKFRQLSTPQGLSHASVMVTYQDQHGFLWIGTRSGLNRYDGNEITTFLHQVEDSTSLANDFIFDIIQVSDDQLFISTEKGLDIYHYSTNDFIRYPNKRLQGYRIHKMEMDMDSTIWITSENGLHHIANGQLSTYLNDPSDVFSISDNYSRNVDTDNRHVYISNISGLNIFDKTTGKFQNKINSNLPVFTNPGEITFALMLSKKGHLWFGSYDSNDEVYINKYNPSTNKLDQYAQGDNGLGGFYALLSIEEANDDLYFGVNGGGALSL